MATDPVLAAEVVMRPADGRRLTGTEQVTAATLARYLPSPDAVTQASNFFAGRGLTVSPAHGISFTISGPRSLLERVFQTAITVEQGPAAATATTSSGTFELPLQALPPTITALLEAVTFTPPADYGPPAP